MLEPTLATLGQFLADSFNVEKKQVAFIDKDGLFSRLSERKFPLKLPAVTYGISDIQLLGNVNRRPNALVASSNLTLNMSHTYNPFPVKCTLSCGLVCGTLSDYFSFVKRYIALNKSATFNVEFVVDKQTIIVDLSLAEIQNLSTPLSGREGREFDRGTYYVLEGGFSINSFILFDTNNKLVRSLTTMLEVNSLTEITDQAWEVES